MILIIDNYDSFTYNLYQYIGELTTEEIQVHYNDQLTLEEVEALAPSHIVLSPGPKYPKDAGICISLIQAFSGKIPLLGICLGHQAIGEAFGAKVVPANRIVHGMATSIHIASGSPIFKSLPPVITAGRYHSLMIEKASMPECLRLIAEDDTGEVMGIAHASHPTFGIQFHPESLLTPSGKVIIRHFLEV
ncbi:MAG: anthranilate synthase component II [Cellulosilyticaceae bacterium]